MKRDSPARKAADVGVKTPVGNLSFDQTGIITKLNLVASKLLGGERTRLLGSKFGLFLSDAERPTFNAMFEQAKSSGSVQSGEISLSESGLFTAKVWIKIARLPGTMGCQAILLDITEREQRADSMGISESFFRATFNSASIGIALCDLKGRYLMVNPAFCAMLGLSELETLARSFHDIIHSYEQPEVTENCQLTAKEIQTNQYEKRYVHKHGHVISGLVSVALVRDAQDVPAYLISQAQGISERKQVETEVLREKRQLRELAAHSDNVREVERKRIAREVHDELGQQLTALRMGLSFVAQQHRENHEVVGQMAELRLQVDRMVGVVRHIVSNLRPSPLDLGIVPALEWLVEDFEVNSGILCRLRMPDLGGGAGETLTLDDARATAIFRIVQESLTNVARHSEANKVIVSLKAGRDYIALRVKDDGKGFDPALVIEGRSFGLLGMQERVLLLQGELHIASAPEKGTNIYFKLPLERRTRIRTGARE